MSTPHQRLYLRCMFARAELPLDRVTVMHRPAFEGAMLPWPEGADLDGALSALTKDQASKLIAATQRRWPHAASAKEGRD